MCRDRDHGRPHHQPDLCAGNRRSNAPAPAGRGGKSPPGRKVVEGAVGMVEMALNHLSENGVVELDEERKAAMVSNLLVVLCGNRDAQPIVNSGSIY